MIYFLDPHETDCLPLDLFPLPSIILKHPGNVFTFISEEVHAGELSGG